MRQRASDLSGVWIPSRTGRSIADGKSQPVGNGKDLRRRENEDIVEANLLRKELGQVKDLQMKTEGREGGDSWGK